MKIHCLSFPFVRLSLNYWCCSSLTFYWLKSVTLKAIFFKSDFSSILFHLASLSSIRKVWKRFPFWTITFTHCLMLSARCHTQRAASGRSSSSSLPPFPSLWMSLVSPALSPGCFLFRNNPAFYVKHSELLVLFLKRVKHLPPLQLPVAASNTRTCRVHFFFLPMSPKPDFKWLKSPKKRSWNVTCCKQYILFTT